MRAANPIPVVCFMLLAAVVSTGGVVLDRIAVIVGKHVIKTSEIERDLRLTEFLNGEPLSFSPDAKRKAAERLIDQEIIRREILMGGYRRPNESDGEAYEKQLIHDRFHDSPNEFSKALVAYGLTEPELRAHLMWQLTVLQFIDQRFRPQAAASSGDKGPDSAQVDKDFNAWLDDARKRERIEYKPEAFT